LDNRHDPGLTAGINVGILDRDPEELKIFYSQSKISRPQPAPGAYLSKLSEEQKQTLSTLAG